MAIAIGLSSGAIRPRRAADAKTLAEQVQIRRTQYGVPHIQGESLEAAAFGFGYCQAEDHLLNIMRGILGARGELAHTSAPATTTSNIEPISSTRQFPRLSPRGRQLSQARSRLSRRCAKASPPG